MELQLDPRQPGVEVAETITADIDRNHDGVLAPDEQREYVTRVLNAVTLDVDGMALNAVPVGATFPEPQSFRRGEGTIQLRADAALSPLRNGAHRLSYHNRHQPNVSVYLANALVPQSDRVAVHAQARDADQRDLTIDYDLRAASRRPVGPWLLLGGMAAIAVVRLKAGATSRGRS